MIITDIEKLKQPCKNVSIFGALEAVKQLEKELGQIQSGIGLASPQIGKYISVAIVRLNSKKIDLINPIITHQYDLMEFDGEGCLSFPGEALLTKRYSEIVVKDSLYTAGRIFTGVEAVAVAHEIGHLYQETMFDYEIERPKVNQKCWCNSGKKYKKCHKDKVIIL